jgi:hypothetical protein
MKTCKICKLVKPLTEFNPASKYKDKIYYRTECKPCNLSVQSSNQASQIKYRNSEKGSAAKKAYKQTKKYKKSELDRQRKRYNEDKMFALKRNIRRRLLAALESKQWKKNTKFSEYIGCSQQELKVHIESKFTEGMTWENYGTWELDHIYPLSLAKTEEEMYKLNHFLNLQPLWRCDNIKKSNKVE